MPLLSSSRMAMEASCSSRTLISAIGRFSQSSTHTQCKAFSTLAWSVNGTVSSSCAPSNETVTVVPALFVSCEITRTVAFSPEPQAKSISPAVPSAPFPVGLLSRRTAAPLCLRGAVRLPRVRLPSGARLPFCHPCPDRLDRFPLIRTIDQHVGPFKQLELLRGL